MPTTDLHVRLSERHAAILDALCAANPIHPSRPAVAAALLRDALDDCDGTGSYAVKAKPPRERKPGVRKTAKGAAR